MNTFVVNFIILLLKEGHLPCFKRPICKYAFDKH